MLSKWFVCLAVILCGMALFAVAADVCPLDGRDYENREVAMVEGKCMMCFNGEWTIMPYNVPESRCKGKL